MSLLNRRMILQNVKKNTLYPLINGWYESPRYTVQITNNNHVKTKAFAGESVNLTRLGQVVSSQPKWFILQKHDVCKLIIKNCILKTDQSVHSNFKIANTSLSSIFKNELINGENTNELVMDTDQTIGCFFLFFQSNTEIEFDIEFWVNGIRYF